MGSEQPMTRREALEEARRRWGRNGGVWERGVNKLVGRYAIIAGKKRLGWVAGESFPGPSTWEAAFLNAAERDAGRER